MHVHLIFVAAIDYENIFTMKISGFMVSYLWLLNGTATDSEGAFFKIYMYSKYVYI